jgi:hypothetical protein
MFKLIEDGYYNLIKDMAEGKPSKFDLKIPGHRHKFFECLKIIEQRQISEDRIKKFKPFITDLLSDEMFEEHDIMTLMDIHNTSRQLGLGNNKKSGNGIDKFQTNIHNWMMNNEEEIRTKP